MTLERLEEGVSPARCQLQQAVASALLRAIISVLSRRDIAEHEIKNGNLTSMGHQKVRNEIQAAFRDVKLGGGISLRQLEAMDNYCEGVTEAEYAALPKMDITDDWAALSTDTLEKYSFIEDLDAEGFRYYIPAYMLSVLLQYEQGAMRVIATLGLLDPQKGERWDFYMMKYSLLNAQQRSAIALFLKELPDCVALFVGDRRVAERAFRDYWHQYL